MTGDPRTRFITIGLLTAFLVFVTIFVWFYEPARGVLLHLRPGYKVVTPGAKLVTAEKATGIAFGKGGTRKGKVGMEIDPEDAVNFTKKASCIQNTAIINNAVELWYAQHGGQWPKEDLSDMARDRDYFPSGIPVCPVTGAPYRLDPVTHRVLGHTHNDIPDLVMPGAEKAGPKPGEKPRARESQPEVP